MEAINWQGLLGRIVGGKYRLDRILTSGSAAAEYASEVSDGTPAAVTVAVPGHAATFDDAARIEHPNIRRVRDGGSETIDGTAIEYIVLDPADETLASRMSAGPLEPGELTPIASSVAEALAYLHDLGLVYMHLSPDSVIRSGDVWQLGNPEFSHARGSATPTITRAMLSRSVYVPPEAFSGVISPAWDVWSFGVLVRRALNGPPPQEGLRGRHRQPALPPPYETLVAQCVEPEPDQRIRMADIARILQPDVPQRTSEAPQETAASAPRRKVRMYDTAIVPPAPVPVGAAAEAPEAADARAPVGEAARTGRTLPPARQPRRSWEESHERKRWVLALIPLAVVLAAALVYSQRDRKETTAPPESPQITKNRAVERPAPPPTVSEPKPSPMEPSAGAAANDVAARRAAVFTLLNTWAATTREMNAQANGRLYAPRVDLYFKRRNVSRDEIVREKAKVFQDIRSVRKFDIGNVKIDSFTPERAVVTFRKDWDFRGAGQFAGAEIARLYLRWNGDNGWQIAREHDVRVYWMHKGAAPREGD